jgi:hypothetical protein
MTRQLSSILLCLGFAAVAFGQEASYPSREADAAASEALRTFARLVDQNNFRQMGFSTPDEAERATLGGAVPERMVRLDRLREYSGGAVGELLTDTGRITYPVQVDGEVRSSLKVGVTDGTWRAVAFGAPEHARRLAAAAAEQGGGDVFEVRVPALNVFFVASRRDGRLILTPLVDDPRFGFEAGAAIPAEEALSSMVEAAREHNGLPT